MSELEDCASAGFVLAVGTREPRKNLPRLVAAYTVASSHCRRRNLLVGTR